MSKYNNKNNLPIDKTKATNLGDILSFRLRPLLWVGGKDKRNSCLVILINLQNITFNESAYNKKDQKIKKRMRTYRTQQCLKLIETVCNFIIYFDTYIYNFK